MASVYRTPGTGPKVDWQARYEAMRSVARRLSEGWVLALGDPDRWFLVAEDWRTGHDRYEPMSPDERRALNELETDRG